MYKISKIFKGSVIAIMIALGLFTLPVNAEPVPTNLEPEDDIMLIKDDEEDVGPTFVLENETSDSIAFWIGKNLLFAGNNLVTNVDASTGLMLAAGNTVTVDSDSEYGFIFGNVIHYNGSTKRDLYIAGNMITLEPESQIGRDVFVAGAQLNVETPIDGDIAVTAGTVVFHDTQVVGNVNLNVDEIRFEGDVEIGGKLTYNDNANIIGRENVTYGELEAYHIEQPSTAMIVTAKIYNKLFSIVALFLAMALILALYPRLHQKVASEETSSAVGKDLAIGLGVLLGVPAFIIFTFMTVIAAPLGFVVLALYLVMIYLSQGFAGIWLGHFILEKLCKFKSNVFLEAFIGVLTLGIVSLIPYLGIISGLLGLLLGLGLILKLIRPRANDMPSTDKLLANGKAKSSKAKAE